jgi:DNA segregation ATPase FtsK/SpoIIIE, S-DNA-T family
MRLFFKKRFHKDKLTNAFNTAGLYYTSERNGKKFYKFPSVLDVRFHEDPNGKPIKTTYVFRLPHGVDPKELKKKEFVFRSMFGDLIEIKGTSTVSLTVFHEVHYGSYDYDFEQLKKVMSKHNLPIIAGKDINGKFHCYDMTTNPHLLVAGETGSGKSVMLRVMLTSLIQYFRHGGLQLHLADLKRSEFSMFRHVDIVKAVMTEKKDVKRCVSWFHKQLAKRGDILDQYELSHIDKYNKLEGVEKQDYLVLCIDEFSLLRDEKETMEQLTDLVALGRALGIYVVLSTQRPSAKVIDGNLKANLTVRFAFRHADRRNSNITLGDGAKADASMIDEEDKGKFFMRFGGFKYLQAPYLDEEDREENGEVILGAKSILKEYKVPLTKRTEYEDAGDIIDHEGEVTESDAYEELDQEVQEYSAPLSLEEGAFHE